MATLTIRNVDDRTHKALRLRAAENGRSVEEEVRRILAEQVSGHKARHGSVREDIRRILEEYPAPAPEYRNPKTPGEIAEAVKQAQEFFAPLRESYSVDRYLAEKRAEARREFQEDVAAFKPEKSRTKRQQ
jgi:hypothetical protein